MTRATTRGAALAAMRAAFMGADLDSPGLDARLLMAHVLGLEPVRLVMDADIPLNDAEHLAIEIVTRRRLAREPVSRIVGERWFRGRRFRLNAATLDPRPDSETLVDAVLAFVDAAGARAVPLRILDLGTGSGCLLLSLLAELPFATGVGGDVSAEALAMAATNATELGVSADRVDWKHGSGFDPVDGIFNVILSNPPYIPTAEVKILDPEVRQFDPISALDGGGDGLDFYRAWSQTACERIDKSLGFIVFEVGSGQADDVGALLSTHAPDATWGLAMHTDLAQINRCVSLSTRLGTLR